MSKLFFIIFILLSFTLASVSCSEDPSLDVIEDPKILRKIIKKLRKDDSYGYISTTTSAVITAITPSLAVTLFPGSLGFKFFVIFTLLNLRVSTWYLGKAPSYFMTIFNFLCYYPGTYYCIKYIVKNPNVFGFFTFNTEAITSGTTFFDENPRTFSSTVSSPTEVPAIDPVTVPSVSAPSASAPPHFRPVPSRNVNTKLTQVTKRANPSFSSNLGSESSQDDTNAFHFPASKEFHSQANSLDLLRPAGYGSDLKKSQPLSSSVHSVLTAAPAAPASAPIKVSSGPSTKADKIETSDASSFLAQGHLLAGLALSSLAGLLLTIN